MVEQQIIQSITDKPTLLAIIKIPTRIPFIKKTKRIEVKGATLHTLFQLTELLTSLDNKGGFYETILSSNEAPAKFLAIAVHNSPSAPPKWLVKSFMHDFSIQQIETMLKATYGRIGFESFFPILGLMMRVNMMPKSTQEATALTL